MSFESLYYKQYDGEVNLKLLFLEIWRYSI